MLSDTGFTTANSGKDSHLQISYTAELRRLAATCEWLKEHLGENLRDKFVMGLRNERLLQQLLTQDHRKPLVDLLELARTFEAVERETFKQGDADPRIGVARGGHGRALPSLSFALPSKPSSYLNCT